MASLTDSARRSRSTAAMLRAGLAIAGVLVASPARADQTDPFDRGTLAYQGVVGLYTGASAASLATLFTYTFGKYVLRLDERARLHSSLAAAAIGGTLGMVLGVDYMGDRRGADGTLLGTAGGFAVGVAGFSALELVIDRGRVPLAVHGTILTVALLGGALIGYHLSADPQGGRLDVPLLGFAF